MDGRGEAPINWVLSEVIKHFQCLLFSIFWGMVWGMGPPKNTFKKMNNKKIPPQNKIVYLKKYGQILVAKLVERLLTENLFFCWHQDKS